MMQKKEPDFTSEVKSASHMSEPVAKFFADLGAKRQKIAEAYQLVFEQVNEKIPVLKSAYEDYQAEGKRFDQLGHPFATSFKPGFHFTIDYIWYSHSAQLQLVKVLEIDQSIYLSENGGTPNSISASDHIPI